MLTVPNILTAFRIVLIPVFLVCFYLPWEHAQFTAAVFFWLAAVTDYFDGYLARKLQQETAFGAFLDPVADKVTVCAALIILVDFYNTLWITIPAIVIISREILISALREWMAEAGKRSEVAVATIGKWKTTAQMLALIGLISHFNGFIIGLAYALLYIATALTIWSMMIYVGVAWRQIVAIDSAKK
ncbi:CDP-diacylglycerol--glycerol-3-phosphate 3-phosphatidyltransferase [Corallincola platygyrae]|uniref:CDP-diacylglycerol--glycerol-3-phosphate 3-phosphatidyltransferase n=1 Tax=Corallincola platygyrae TaxID=1193278 RepID=A0ABW4XGL2_9GAMM